MIPSTVLLSVLNGVASCRWSSSSNVVLIGDSSNAFMYSPPTSASAADSITTLIILASTYIGPLN